METEETLVQESKGRRGEDGTNGRGDVVEQSRVRRGEEGKREEGEKTREREGFVLVQFVTCTRLGLTTTFHEFVSDMLTMCVFAWLFVSCGLVMVHLFNY